jgi:hypothetical protein
VSVLQVERNFYVFAGRSNNIGERDACKKPKRGVQSAASFEGPREVPATQGADLLLI